MHQVFSIGVYQTLFMQPDSAWVCKVDLATAARFVACKECYVQMLKVRHRDCP